MQACGSTKDTTSIITVANMGTAGIMIKYPQRSWNASGWEAAKEDTPPRVSWPPQIIFGLHFLFGEELQELRLDYVRRGVVLLFAAHAIAACVQPQQQHLQERRNMPEKLFVSSMYYYLLHLPSSSHPLTPHCFQPKSTHINPHLFANIALMNLLPMFSSCIHCFYSTWRKRSCIKG